MVRPKPNQTPIVADAEMVQRFLTEQPDIRSIFKEPSYEELKVVLERYLDPDAGKLPVARTESTETPVSKPVSPTAAKSVEMKSTSVKDMIDEFDEVFN
jgi:hypothetical protein